MSIEQRIAALMAESQEFAETNEDAPKGLPKQKGALSAEASHLAAATKEENPDAAKADVDTEKEAEGGTSKKPNAATAHASAPEASHLRKESVEGLEESASTFESIKKHPIGTVIHPTDKQGHNYSVPMTITGKSQGKTELTRNFDKKKFHVSHDTGEVTDHKGEVDSDKTHFRTADEKKKVGEQDKKNWESYDSTESVEGLVEYASNIEPGTPIGHIKKHPVGTVIHPTDKHGHSYTAAMTVTGKSQGKTEVTRNFDKKKFNVSHDTGEVTDHKGTVDHHSLTHFRTEEGKKKAMEQDKKNWESYDSKEDVAALVEGEELSEEFKVKAAVIFEAAVISRVKAEVSKLDEQYAESFAIQLEEAVSTEVQGLIEKVDGYLGYMAETWMKDNEIALDRGLKSEILESFVSSLKGVFEEHYIDVPETATDMVAEMETKVAELAEKLNESESRNIEMFKSIQESTRLGLIESKCSGLTDTDVEKFKGLAEELAFDTAETFSSKLKIIRESYFDKKTPAALGNTFLNESESMIVEEKVLSPAMAAYTRALSKV